MVYAAVTPLQGWFAAIVRRLCLLFKDVAMAWEGWGRMGNWQVFNNPIGYPNVGPLGIAYRFLLLLSRLLRFSAHFERFLSLWNKNTNLLNSAFADKPFKPMSCINYSVRFAKGGLAGR